MSRPLRIQYPGAVYHVMNRGGGSQPIFRSKNNYQAFLELLEETVKQRSRGGWRYVVFVCI